MSGKLYIKIARAACNKGQAMFGTWSPGYIDRKKIDTFPLLFNVNFA